MAYKITIDGIVQGVGFRPFVYNLATSLAINGYVKNSTNGVIIVLDCSDEKKDIFLELLKKNAPPSSVIISIEEEDIDLKEELYNFTILDSENIGGVTLIPSDIAVCKDCLRELLDPQDRRYLYPFINCTNCGPRYSIIKSIPYDRKNTTMASFKMCHKCEVEYETITNRRFHAQPNCCHNCGPDVYSAGLKGLDAIKYIADIINKGEIAAVKGLGGYHLICDAYNDNAIAKLRALKKRQSKPLAVMVKDAITLKSYLKDGFDGIINCIDNRQAPIVIFEWIDNPLSKLINPLGNKIGVMKAYTPLHRVLFEYVDSDFLVATSGNQKDEPIAINEVDAEDKLKIFTNYFLHHNRPIHNRVDDSVVTIINNEIYPIRRARGFAPDPIILFNNHDRSIFGVGSHLKSHISLSKGRYVFTSQFIGDLDNTETVEFYEETFKKLKELFDIHIDYIVRDLHPDYASSIFAERLAKSSNIPVFTLQHHKAHLHACMAENGLQKDVQGVIFDGTGLGEDGNIWGGEFFSLKDKLKRRFHIKYFLQPGADNAAQNPYRMWLGYLLQIGMDKDLMDIALRRFDAFDEVELLKATLSKRINSFMTSSMGRLFEAVGAMLTGIKTNEYEGYSAIAMELLAKHTLSVPYSYSIEDDIINIDNMITEIIYDVKKGIDPSFISYRFHNTIAEIINYCCLVMAEEGVGKDVVLSGGVFQNTLLLGLTIEKLKNSNLNPVIHKKVPPNDACISLGQVYYRLIEKNSLDDLMS